MKVTRAVITAAGRGTRFLPLVKAYPKELIPILNKPQIQYLVEEILGAGIHDICIVHQPGNSAIKKYFTRDPDLEKYLRSIDKISQLDSLRQIWKTARFHFIPQSRHLPYGNCSPILSAQNFIGNHPFVYLFGDDLTLEPTPGYFLSQEIKTFESLQPKAIFAVQPVPHPEIVSYDCVQFHPEPVVSHQVARIIEKPSLDEAPSDMANGGRIVVSPEIVQVLKQTKLGKNNELWFVDALNILAKSGVVIAQNYRDYGATWQTTGDPHSWLAANQAMIRLLQTKL